MNKLLIIPALALALNGCSTDCRSPIGIFEAPAIPAGAIKTGEEEAALAMIRMGFDRWTIACAFAHAKDGKSLDEAMKNCAVNFHLDEGHKPS